MPFVCWVACSSCAVCSSWPGTPIAPSRDSPSPTPWFTSTTRTAPTPLWWGPQYRRRRPLPPKWSLKGSLDMASKQKKRFSHELLETNIGLLIFFSVLVISIAGLAQIIPLFFQHSTTQPVEGVKPYEALQLVG